MTAVSRQMTKGQISGSDKKLLWTSDLEVGRIAANRKEKEL